MVCVSGMLLLLSFFFSFFFNIIISFSSINSIISPIFSERRKALSIPFLPHTAEATWALFVLLSSTLVCYHPTELIWALLFHKFSHFTPTQPGVEDRQEPETLHMLPVGLEGTNDSTLWHIISFHECILFVSYVQTDFRFSLLLLLNYIMCHQSYLDIDDRQGVCNNVPVLLPFPCNQ